MTTLNRNNSNWSFEERRKINENWDVLEGIANSTATGNNGLKNEVEQLKVTVSNNTQRTTQSLQLSNQADVKSTQALNLSTSANENSNTALSTALGIDEKANSAITRSNQAYDQSSVAIETANNSKQTADTVQERFDEIVAEAGSNNPEVVASRTDGQSGQSFTNLSQRLDQQNASLVNNVDQTTIRTAPNRPVRTLFGVIRNSTGTWEFITDAAHEKLNFGGLSIVGQELEIAHGFLASKVGSIVVAPDETMAGSGITVGPSVGTTLSRLKFYAPMSCVVNGSGQVILQSDFTKNVLRAELLANGSGFTLTHPTVFNGIGDVPSVCQLTETSTTRSGTFRISYSQATVQVQHFSNLAGFVSYNGTEWTYLSDNINSPTISFNNTNGDLTMTFNADVAPLNNFGITLTPRSRYIPIIKSAAQNMLIINFIDSTTGQVVNTLNNDLRFFFSRDIQVPSKMPTSMRVAINRGQIQVPAADVVTGTSGNFWIYGAMNARL